MKREFSTLLIVEFDAGDHKAICFFLLFFRFHLSNGCDFNSVASQRHDAWEQTGGVILL